MRRFIIWSMLLVCSGTAHAEWLQSSSDHFLVYANDNERNIRAFSQQLERYDAAMALLTNMKRPPLSPSNRVTVYVVNNEREVRKLYGDGAKYIGGFYVPRAGGSLAIIPRVTARQGTASQGMIVLLHEYAHHFLISTSSFPVPRWMSEGSAEFFAAASFEGDGGIGIGRPARHRAYELFSAPDVKVTDLLDPAEYDKRKGKGYDAFYGKSWLLYHYLVFDSARSGQMERYVRLLTQGKSLRDAAQEAFGDLGQLEKGLLAYKAKTRMSMLKLPAARLRTGGVEVSKLSTGEAAIMPIRIRSHRGVNREQAGQLLVDARDIAARFSTNPAVLTALAEAEHDAGNDKEAVAAADAALAIDPAQVNAYVQKGYALFHLASTAQDKATAYREARAPFIALNRLENDHPLALYYYYQSFARQGVTPPPVAVEGLERAAFIAPFDLGLRMTLAMQLLRNKRPGQARFHLLPVAYNPHGGQMAERAQQILARMDTDAEWDGTDFRPGTAIKEDTP
ncbi:DUF1570 domain-containing protein [Sphingobium sufflavum]|uniref:DUF1570 domain-containing protein n=1 Tax=Sphingobium sufflavum TaxID=1129547 RepID=UPI001F41A08B|nr:DUF1570 domain-containing protein [Sphingobium sufflavum]